MKVKLVAMIVCLGLLVPLIRWRTGGDAKQLRQGAIQLHASLADVSQGFQVLQHRATRVDTVPQAPDHRTILTSYTEEHSPEKSP